MESASPEKSVRGHTNFCATRSGAAWGCRRLVGTERVESACHVCARGGAFLLKKVNYETLTTTYTRRGRGAGAPLAKAPVASSPSFSDVIVVHRFHCDCLLTMLLAFVLPPFGLLELPPSIERLIINVGSNDDPLLSPDNQTGAIAFEPIVGCKIKPSPKIEH